MHEPPPTRILVAGATGNLGRALIPVLHERGKEVVALVRPGRQEALTPLRDHIAGIECAEVAEPDFEARVLAGAHTVISCIGITRQRDGLTYDQVDFGANRNLLRAAEESGVRRFVYVSVVGADADVAVPVIRAKRRFETTLADSTLQWQIVRPSGFFTDLTDVWEMARTGTVHLFGDGRSRISPIHPIDLAAAIVDLLEAEPGTIVSVGGPEDFTWNEIAELCCRVAGTRRRIRHWPVWLLRCVLLTTRFLAPSTYGALSFLGHVMTHETTAAHHGSRGLEEFLAACQDSGRESRR